MNLFNKEPIYTFGGYILDNEIRFCSTSGGAFSAIVDAYCDNNYVIFGAEADGLNVFHSYITDKKDLYKYRKSKYTQSKMGNCYKEVKTFLLQGKKVLFSGVPCQIAGLKMFLNNTDISNLITVEVICEGVPSPLYIRKYENFLFDKFKNKIKLLDYRYKGKTVFNRNKWDFQMMKTTLYNSPQEITVDRWFNPFWSIWLQHLMSRPSCYKCKFTRKERTADITLGDLWGVHLYCPELYGNNRGSSLIIANTEKGKQLVLKAKNKMYGHELNFLEALKYQAPLRKSIDYNPQRNAFMIDLQSEMSYIELNKKWSKKPTLKQLWQKYFWGNRQKIWLWELSNGKYKIK